MLDALRRAGDEPVSFSELRQAGVEFPASIVSELELAGVAIERCRGVRGASVRLARVADPVQTVEEPVQEPVPLEHDWTNMRRYRGSSRDDVLLAFVGSKRMLAPLALLVAILAAAIIVFTGTGTGAGSGASGKPSREPIAQAPRTTAPATTATPHQAATTATTTTTTSTTSTPVSPALATQLESQGHDLLGSGHSSAAVPVLKRAVAATGENVGACVEPQSAVCLTYAYALYDLGHALRLSGNPAAAVPILERRLQIDNQRPTVLAELELARQGAT